MIREILNRIFCVFPCFTVLALFVSLPISAHPGHGEQGAVIHAGEHFVWQLAAGLVLVTLVLACVRYYLGGGKK
ncbi:hypothetical protein GCM10025791_48100 [Halioxenophilus aromaticivorans]|uniref:DUF2933 domain-containing protein n=2 Tax=Halioxenophilus aromaticivorans TaxID=1306992 RepID=A0AAV3UA15_9ALTE